jgi:hypothetical protein
VGQGGVGGGAQGPLPDLAPLGTMCEKSWFRGSAVELCETQALTSRAWVNAQVLPVELPSYRVNGCAPVGGG